MSSTKHEEEPVSVLPNSPEPEQGSLSPDLPLDEQTPAQEEARERLLNNLLLTAIGSAARRAFDAKMRNGYQYQSELVRELVGQGMVKRRLEGERAAIFQVLKARGLKVDDSARQRIEACTQLEQLERWLRAAVTAQSVQELFK
jgi:hypothetical protein